MKSLYDTYENASSVNYIKDNNELLKIAHSRQNAQVELTINQDGNFVGAQFVPKDEADTVIPVTESSASRSSGSAPHALCDKLKYIAGDYEKYTGTNNTKYHDDYMTCLSEWVHSSYTSPKINAVFEYLNKGCIIQDLVESNIFSIENGKITEKWLNTDIKLSPGKQEDAFIRFRVSGVDEITALWQDTDLQEKYINYYLQKQSDKKFCYIIGKDLPSCGNHPSRIRNSGDFAKLISSNDTSGFTYRGRFNKADEAFTISYEASQKAHNALKWLISKQGQRVGDKVFVLWGVKNEKIPPLIINSFGFVKKAEKDLDTKFEAAKSFNNAITGYRHHLNNNSKLILLGVDAATPGRLSVVFYREFMGQQGNELIDNIKNWHENCTWRHSYRGENGKGYFNGAPSPIDIAKVAYGTEQNGEIKCNNEKILANAVERILPCISDGAKIPRDIVNAAVNKSFTPQNYSVIENWYKVLATACSLYRKYLFDYINEEVISMNINDDYKDLSYNCGRLLAVADAIEGWALKEKDIDRVTNAVRYFTRFSKRPCETWSLINERLSVYKQQLGSRGSRMYKLLGEISGKIDPGEFANAKNLDGRMSLGFDSQRQALIMEAIEKSNEKKNNNKDGGNEDGNIEKQD
jgi:CRISPR-associated protein Csd1